MLKNGVFLPSFDPEITSTVHFQLFLKYIAELEEAKDVRSIISEDFAIEERFKAVHKNPAMEKVMRMREMEKQKTTAS